MSFLVASLFSEGQFGSKYNYSLITEVICSSNALTLAQCTVKSGDCLPICTNNIGIRCYSKLCVILEFMLYFCCVDYGSCKEGAVQLVNGETNTEGRVEVCVNGIWSNVCDKGWDKIDAHIICLQLGYQTSASCKWFIIRLV